MLSLDDGVTFEATPPLGTHLFSLSGSTNDIFQPRGIIQASPGYGSTGAPPDTELDRNYFYVAGNNAQQGGANFDTSENGLIYLCRYQHAGLGAPTLNGTNLRNRANYAFFTGRNANGASTWGNPGDLKSPNAKPIFRNIIGGTGIDFGFYWQCHWHPALQQWVAVWSPQGNQNRLSIAHAPSLWDNSWQMLANNVDITNLPAAEKVNNAFLAASSPAAWSTATNLGIGLSTFVGAPRAGDDLILTKSSDLVALPGGRGDLAVGQETSGTLTWVANDQNAKPIVINTVGNTLEQPDRTCIVTLSNAVNGTISAASATTTLHDDDAPIVTTGYDETRIYGGLGVGIAYFLGQPGNERIADVGYVSFRMEHTGSIDRIAWHNRFGTGYSIGNGGTIHWAIRRITSAPGVEALTTGPVISVTPNVVNPVLPASWANAFRAVGGTGAQGRFSDFPTLIFNTPVAVTAGEMIAFVFTQTATNGDRSSYNCSFSNRQNVAEYSPFEYGKYSHAYNPGSSSDIDYAYLPCIIYGYTDGRVAGNPMMGQTTPPAEIIIGQGDWARQVIPMPDWANGKKLKTVHAGMWRMDNTTTADIVCRVRRAGSTPGGPNDNGTQLGTTVTIAATAVEFETELKQTVPTDNTRDIFRALTNRKFDFSNQNITFATGDVIYFELGTSAGTGTRYHGQKMQNYLQFSGVSVGITTPTAHRDIIINGNRVQMRGQIMTGTTWASINSTGVNYVPIWAEFV
jgi:hypothetical protein